MKLSTCIVAFFNQYLTGIKGVSAHTVKAYRDTFSILLPFAAKYHGIKIDSLRLDHLSFDLIIAFLNFLESDRNNGIRTRNHRLAVIKSFAKMIRFLYPDKRKIAETIIHIPQKRSQRKLIGFLYPDEILNTDFHRPYNRQISTQIKRSRLSPRFYRKAMELETVFVVFQLLLR